MSEKLEEMDKKLDTLCIGMATLTQLVSTIKEKVDDHEETIYGCKEYPGLRAQVTDAVESVSRVRKIALAAATAFVGGLVSLVISLAKSALPGVFKGD